MPWRVAGLAVRFVLAVTLLWGAFLTALSTFPAERELADFRRDLRAGRVETIVVVEGNDSLSSSSSGGSASVSSLTWTADSLIWRRLREPWNARYRVRELDTDLAAASFSGTLIRRPDGGGRGFWPAWPAEVPHRYGWFVQLAWITAFFVMLASRPRLANRWAWFWMFTVGQYGAPLFVLLEPRPIWSALDPVPPRVVQPVSGGAGCALALLLAYASGVLLWGIGAYVAGLTG
ncbi:hypothetical protein [Nonomuraea typhae]|uniref:Uncharacterized protein n=1 Tax=Nonomuraea typhae TaxID=2603600 RepID=A0ABW7Z943_9ACTN